MKLKTLILNRKLLFVLSIIFFTALMAVDDQDISVRRFDEKEMSNYSNSEDFSYMDLTVQPPSIWQRLQWWFAALLAKIFGNPNAPWISKVLFYLILIGVLALTLFYILRLKYGSGFSSESKYLKSKGLIGSQAKEKLNFDELINSALEDKQYKLAIRYLYLKSLSILSEREMITFKDWKSPYDYERELDKSIVPTYHSLTQLFERAWYGDYHVDDKEFATGHDLVATIEQAAR